VSFVYVMLFSLIACYANNSPEATSWIAFVCTRLCTAVFIFIFWFWYVTGLAGVFYREILLSFPNM
jgi:hypothetical protein